MPYHLEISFPNAFIEMRKTAPRNPTRNMSIRRYPQVSCRREKCKCLFICKFYDDANDEYNLICLNFVAFSKRRTSKTVRLAKTLIDTCTTLAQAIPSRQMNRKNRHHVKIMMMTKTGIESTFNLIQSTSIAKTFPFLNTFFL